LGLRDYGNLNWAGFRTGKFSDGAGNHDIAPNLNKLPHMLDSLKSHGYDVLIVDHRNGRNYIEANAGATIRLIQWLNQELANNGSTEEIVVLGASMGGLIARYALRKMEIDGCCHNVRMYGTFDSPHGGANVPVGIQKMVQTMAYKMPVSFAFEDMRRAYEYGLCSPGAAQMLKYHVNVISPYNPSNLFGNPAYWNYNPWRTIYGNMDYQKIRSEWEHLLDSIGHPQDAFKINIVNGSINGTHQAFPPGALLFDFMIDIDAPIDYPNTYQSWPIHGMKAYAISPNPNNIILTRRGILASVTSSLLYTFNFATYLAGLPSMIWGGYPFNSIMNDFHQANAALSTNHYQNTSLLPYDNCPGSTAPTMIQIQGEFVNVLCGYVFQNTLAKQHTHSFVATPSALSLDTTNLGANFYFNLPKLLSSNRIPFDTLWFPAEFDNRGNLIASVNQRHVDMTTENLAWILSNIEANANFLSTQGQSALHKNLTNVFNFGRKHRKFIRQLDIDFGGYALVNHNLYGYDYAGYLNGNRPQPGSNFDVYTSASNCNGSWVNIKNGGVFEVGGDSSTADVHIKKGTFLQIFSGGVLKINNYSKVIIEPGASLIIHPGATIYLNGEDAVLDLQGNVELKQDASFTFIGSGFVRYAMNHNQGAQWSLEGNNTFVMRGANRNDLVMQIEEDAYLEDFEQVTFAKGRVEFPEYKALHIGSPVKIDTALFAPSDTSNLSSAGFFGVILQGSKNQTVSNSRFIGASFGLANNGLRGYGVTIDKCYFVKNTIGLRLEGPGGRILNSRFYSNETGLDANNITLEVRAELCQFKFNDQLGIAFSGSDGNASIKVLSSQVSNNNWSGLQAMNGTVQTRCSQFNQNTYAGIIADRSRIILRGTTVASNQIGFTGVGLALLNINNGYNAFINNSSTVDFEALLDASYSSLFTTTFKALKNDVSSSISIGKINGPLTVLLSAPASPSGAFYYPVIHCMSAQPGGGAPFSGTLSNLNPIGTNGNSCDSCRFYVGSTMEVALEDIYARLEERNPATLLEDIYRADEIAMVYEEKSLNPTDQLLRDFALMAEVEGLAAAFSEGLLVPGDDIEYTNLVINRLQSVQYDTTASGQERRFSNKIAQALTYRLNHDYTNALSLLNTYPSFATTPVQTNQALYWTCALEGERDLLNGALSFDEFLVWNATCAQTFGMRGPQAAFEPSPVVWEQAPLAVGAQPNPATERTTVAFSHPVEGTLTLVDLMGTAVAGPFNLQGAEQLEVPLALPAGVYVVVVQTTTAERATCKLVIH
jgi:hypothetical protein